MIYRKYLSFFHIFKKINYTYRWTFKHFETYIVIQYVCNTLKTYYNF